MSRSVSKGVKKKKTTAKRPTPRKRAPAAGDEEICELRLYVAGQTPKSKAAVENLERICRENVEGRYNVEVIDLLKDPALARGDQILAIPTLVRKLPSPIRKIIGDLSNAERVVVGLDLKTRRA